MCICIKINTGKILNQDARWLPPLSLQLPAALPFGEVATHAQRAATRCNTLQYTAIHCNTLLRTAAHRNTLQHTAILCNTLQHTAIRCSTL